VKFDILNANHEKNFDYVRDFHNCNKIEFYLQKLHKKGVNYTHCIFENGFVKNHGIGLTYIFDFI